MCLQNIHLNIGPSTKLERYRGIQPPTLPDEHRPAVHEYSNRGVVATAVTPRCTHARLQPRTHSIVVVPPGASTTNSKSGAVVCALPAAQPAPTKINARPSRNTMRFMRHLHVSERD